MKNKKLKSPEQLIGHKGDLVYDVFPGRLPEPRVLGKDFLRSFKVEIYAVGHTVEEALKALGKELKWGTVKNITFERDLALSPCEWYVRFHVGAGGTSMKAAGEYVTGGVIVTWWK